jgi:hypothetical protein
MLITVHPLEVSIQKGLVDHHLRRQSHEKPLLAKVLNETVHRVPDATQMFLQGPAGAAPRRIGFPETGEIPRRDALAHRGLRAPKMLIKMGKDGQMNPNPRATETLLEQPLTETIQDCPQRSAPQLLECRRTHEHLFQRHGNLLFLGLVPRQSEVVIDWNYVHHYWTKPRKTAQKSGDAEETRVQLHIISNFT